MPSTRFINALSRLLTNLPVLPQVVTAPTAGMKYPSGRAISRLSNPSASGAVFRTWIAQDNAGGWSQAIRTAGGSVHGNTTYYVCDPSTIDWSGITLTGPRPQNPLGGLDSYSVTVGTMRLKTGATTLLSLPAIEVRQPFLVGNTLVEASKIARPCNSPNSVDPLDSLRYGGITLVGSTFFGDRWIGGGISVSRVGLGTSTGVIVYPVDPGTLIADTSTGVNIGTVSAGTAHTFTAADLLGAGLVRWDYFFIGAALNSVIDLLSPLDLPPPYDCPGYDVPMLKGGYLS